MVEPRDFATAANGTRVEGYCSTCYRAGVFSRAAGSHEDASARLSDYLQREVGLPPDEADRRADELTLLLEGGGASLASGPLLAFAGVGALAEHWWMFALRGLLAVLFGVFAIARPLAALAALVLTFGIWAFVDGLNALILSIRGWRSWQLALIGVVGIVAGVFTFLRPAITALGLYATVASWAIVRGILELAVAIQLRKAVRGEVWLVLGGIASIVFGVLLVALPLAGILALAWLISVYALTFGFIMFALSLKLRALRGGREAHPQEARTPPIGAPTTAQPA